MKAKKFIGSVREFLGLEDNEDKGKKKSLKILLEKLEKKRVRVANKLSNIDKSESDERDELKLDLSVIDAKIKKGRVILEKLQSKKAKD